MRFAAFFGDKEPFPADGTDLKIFASWCYNQCPNGR